MRILLWPASALAWLGRQGTRAVALSIFLGLALPQLAASFKPFVPETIFLLLVLAFLRVEPRALRAYLFRPGLVLGATLWIMALAPLVFGGVYVWLGVAEAYPALFLALVLQATAAPIMSAPAFAALMGLDAALSLAVLMLCIALTPITTPLLVYILAGASFEISPLLLALKLLILLAGSASLAWIVRYFAGARWVAAQRERIDGLNVVALFVFAVAVMDGIAALFWSRPLFAFGLTVLTFAIAMVTLGLTAFLFSLAGRAHAFALGLVAANRNMGIMLAAAGGALPELAWNYAGLAQFPIYLAPLLLDPLARHMVQHGASPGDGAPN